MFQYGIWADEDSSIPLEVFILEAANDDPLRAQELEESLREDWWYWWLLIRNAKMEARSNQ